MLLITSGFSETGKNGRKLENELVIAARNSGAWAEHHGHLQSPYQSLLRRFTGYAPARLHRHGGTIGQHGYPAAGVRRTARHRNSRVLRIG